MNNVFKNRNVPFFGSLIAAVLCVIAAIVSLVYTNAVNEPYPLVPVCLFAAAAIIIINIFVNGGLLNVLAAILAGVSAAAFTFHNIGSYVDYIYKINMFGNVSFISVILAATIMMAVAALVLVIVSFTGTQKKTV